MKGNSRAEQVTILVLVEVEEIIIWKFCRLNVGNKARGWRFQFPAIVEPGPIVYYLQDKFQGFALQDAQVQCKRKGC